MSPLAVEKHILCAINKMSLASLLFTSLSLAHTLTQSAWLIHLRERIKRSPLCACSPAVSEQFNCFISPKALMYLCWFSSFRSLCQRAKVNRAAFILFLFRIRYRAKISFWGLRVLRTSVVYLNTCAIFHSLFARTQHSNGEWICVPLKLPLN